MPERRIVDLSEGRSRRFFQDLRDCPFIALVVKDDQVHVFRKGVGEIQLSALKAFIEELESHL